MTPSTGIPDGTYRDPSGIDTIVVEGEDLHFDVRASGAPGRMHQRDLEYTLGPDGRIGVYTLTSNERLGPVGSYWWFWDGEAIRREDYGGGNPVRFERDRPGEAPEGAGAPGGSVRRHEPTTAQ